MKSKALLAIILASVIIISAGIGMRVGARNANEHSARELASVQAMLAFNRIMDERNMQSLLTRGCINQAKQWVEFYYDQNMVILAEKYKDGISTDVIEYINDRDPNILNSLGEFRSKYGMSWIQKACK